MHALSKNVGLPSLVLLIVDKPKKEIPSAEDVSATSVSIVLQPMNE